MVALLLSQTKNMKSRGESVYLRRKKRRRQWKGHKFQDAGLRWPWGSIQNHWSVQFCDEHVAFLVWIRSVRFFAVKIFQILVLFFGKIWWCFLIVSACFWFLKQQKANFVSYYQLFLIIANIFSLIGKVLHSRRNFGNFNRFMVHSPREMFHRHSNHKINNLFCRNKTSFQNLFFKSFLFCSGLRSNIVIFSRFFQNGIFRGDR